MTERTNHDKLKQGLAPEGLVHFTGIGGIGMSGIAETMRNLGFAVQGSDCAESPTIERLRALAIPVWIGHDPSLVQEVSVVVYSSAVHTDNPELQRARALRIPVVRRAEILAELMRFKTAVAVAGTHGKTTTTSLIATLFEACGLDPTVINGGVINAFGSTARKGESAWMVVEADESDGSFLHLRPSVAVVTNIDPEHMDHYESFQQLCESFRIFVESIPFYGFAVLCCDHPEVQRLASQIVDRRVLTYGFGATALYRARNVRADPRGCGMRFSLEIAGEKARAPWHDIALPMFGTHNVLNALAALAVADRIGLEASALVAALARFKGVKRRFSRLGAVAGITVVDDYGHHPVEISAVLRAARPLLGKNGRLHAVFQPHRYSRLKNLLEDFCQCFDEADQVFIAEVYSAGEAPIADVDSARLVEGLRARGHSNVQHTPSLRQITESLARQAREGDYVVFLGAGSITHWAHQFLPLLAETRKTLSESALP